VSEVWLEKLDEKSEEIMTNRKLTDAEMMEALADCFHKDHKFMTVYDGKSQEIAVITMQDILDMFNRQKAEIERLKKENEKLHKNIDREIYREDIVYFG
jgi:predicted transcriptional regulator